MRLEVNALLLLATPPTRNTCASACCVRFNGLRRYKPAFVVAVARDW